MSELEKAAAELCDESPCAAWIANKYDCDLHTPADRLLGSGALVEVELVSVPDDVSVEPSDIARVP
jgi:hypothetical protein